MPRGVPCLPGQIPCIPVRVRLPVANVAEVAVRGHDSITGKPWVNTHAYSLPGPLTLTLAQDIATQALAHIVPVMTQMMSASSVFDDVRVGDLLVPTSVAVVKPVPGNTRGVDSNPPLPANVAATMSYKSGVSGRSHNGRQFNTGLTFGDIAEDSLLAGYMLKANDTAVAWNTLTSTLATIHPVVASITKGIFTQIISHVIDSFVDSHRKRLPKG